MVVQLPDHIFMARPDPHAAVLTISRRVFRRKVGWNMPSSDDAFHASCVEQISMHYGCAGYTEERAGVASTNQLRFLLDESSALETGA